MWVGVGSGGGGGKGVQIKVLLMQATCSRHASCVQLCLFGAARHQKGDCFDHGHRDYLGRQIAWVPFLFDMRTKLHTCNKSQNACLCFVIIER